MKVEIARMASDLIEDFYTVHNSSNGCDWCYCVAWWVPTWNGFGERTADENKAFRDKLFERGEFDGYLMYIDGEPAGWCQVGLRDRLEKLRLIYPLEPEPDVWAITCFLIAPAYRGKGLARTFLDNILMDLSERNVEKVEVYPRKGDDLPKEDVWTGPEKLFAKSGFHMIRDDVRRPVYRKLLTG